MIKDKNLIGKKKPRGFYTVGNDKDQSIKNIISWYLFVCKIKNNNKPSSQKQLNKFGESSIPQYFSGFGLAKNDIDQEHFGEVIQKEWHGREFTIKFYTEKALKLGRPLSADELKGVPGLKMAMVRYNINKPKLDNETFGHSIQFDWEGAIKKDPDFILNIFKEIYEALGRSPTGAEISYYCEEHNPFSGPALLGALARQGLKKSDIDIELNCPPPSGCLVTLRSGKIIAVKSVPEVYIANMLDSYGLDFEYEGIIDPNRRYQCDFKIINGEEYIYIEYFGFGRRRKNGNSKYSSIEEAYIKKMNAKRLIYKEKNLKLIDLDADFFDRDKNISFQEDFYSLLKGKGIEVGEFKGLRIVDLAKSLHGNKWDPTKVVESLKKVFEEAGRFVSEAELRRMGRHGLINAIRIHHPTRSVLGIAKELGVEDDRPSGGMTGRPPKDWMPFKKARAFARSLNLRSIEEWDLYCREGIEGLPPKPEDIPNASRQVYKEWVSIHDWLGYENAPFEDAKKFAKSLGLKAVKEWVDYCKGKLPHLPPKPDNIPNTLQHMKETVYKDEFTTSEDFLGIITFTYDQAKDFAISLGLKSLKEWESYCRGEIPDLPPRPYYIKRRIDQVYQNKGWTNWGDFLGYRNQYQGWLPYKEAREFARGLGLKSYKEWILYIKGQMLHLPEIPNNIPKAPQLTYKNKGWESDSDWLGNKAAKPKINKKFSQQQLEL